MIEIGCGRGFDNIIRQHPPLNGKISVNQRLTKFPYGAYQTFALQMRLGAQIEQHVQLLSNTFPAGLFDNLKMAR